MNIGPNVDPPASLLIGVCPWGTCCHLPLSMVGHPARFLALSVARVVTCRIRPLLEGPKPLPVNKLGLIFVGSTFRVTTNQQWGFPVFCPSGATWISSTRPNFQVRRHFGSATPRCAHPPGLPAPKKPKNRRTEEPKAEPIPCLARVWPKWVCHVTCFLLGVSLLCICFGWESTKMAGFPFNHAMQEGRGR